MGNCIICGTTTDGPICDTHQEDVVFEFRGDSPSQLTEGRFYEGVVDGYADFGVFVDLSDSVTGLLHRSKLDRRLESLDWDPGDHVYVQVTNVRDNGDVDLGWSIRQSERDFRGRLIDSPEGDFLAEEEESEGGASEEEPETGAEADAESETETETGEPETGEPGTGGETEGKAESETSVEAETSTETESETSGDGEAERGDETGATPAPTAGQGRAEALSEGAEPEAGTGHESASGSESESDARSEGAAPESEFEPEKTENGEGEAERTDETAESNGEPEESVEVERAPVETLRERVGDTIAIEGEIVSVRQTSGPTVFELRDETAVVDCAAFEEAGVRAYPEVETGDVVRLTGEVRVRRDELQVETEELAVLEGDEREAVEERMAAALDEEAQPERVEPLAVDEVIADLNEDLREAATAIRRAVAESRPVVVRHAATTDGYVAGAAIERAVLPLVAEEHAASDASYHYFDRRPLEGDVYDMDDATKDVTGMLGDQERHDEKFPLFVFAAAGGTRESLDGLGLLEVYDAERVVIDGQPVDEEVREAVETTVAPDAAERTATTVGATLAAAINDAIRDDLAHLPAVSYWDDTPEQYVELAEQAGVDAETASQLREAVALEAYYQSYEDKRELIIDLLFERDEGGDGVGLAEQVATQFETKMEAEMDTALANLERREAAGVSFAVLDTDSYTHRFDFPPKRLLLDELHRRVAEGDRFVTIGIAKDELFLRATQQLDLRAIADEVAESAENAGVAARGAREGKIEFLSGERDEVLKAVIRAVADRVAAAA
ncbi:MAG: OB-fold nucleic acid binding domain-containing protein [Haloglomus sp.]